MAIYIFNKRTYFYQYDIDQKFIVEDEDVNELHFANGSLDNAYTVKCYTEDNIKLCDIPNSFLEKSGILTVYAYCVVNGEYTKRTYRFNVVGRKKPNDYVEEEDAPRWSVLEKQVDNLRNDIENFEVSEEMIESSVDAYLKENPIEIPSEYITEEELDAKGYLTEHQDLSSYALKSELPTDYAPKEHTHENLATKEDLENVSVSEEQIESVVETYLEENPIEGVGGVDVTYDEEQKAIIFSGSGGNGGASASEWELVSHTLLEEDTNSIEIDFGKKYQQLYVEFKVVNSGTATNLSVDVSPRTHNDRAFYHSVSANNTTYFVLKLERIANFMNVQGINCLTTGQQTALFHAGGDGGQLLRNVLMVSTSYTLDTNFDGLNGIRFRGISFSATTEIYIYGR